MIDIQFQIRIGNQFQVLNPLNPLKLPFTLRNRDMNKMVVILNNSSIGTNCKCKLE